MDYLANIKALLMLPDSAKDDLINVIIDNTKRALRVRLGLSASDAVPDELSYIVVEVSVRRYNRLKNEGMVSYSQEEKASFSIQTILQTLKKISRLGKTRTTRLMKYDLSIHMLEL